MSIHLPAVFIYRVLTGAALVVVFQVWDLWRGRSSDVGGELVHVLFTLSVGTLSLHRFILSPAQIDKSPGFTKLELRESKYAHVRDSCTP